MLFFSKPKPVQCFAYEEGVLYLQTSQTLSPAKTYSMQAELPVSQQGEAPLNVTLKARVLQSLEATPLFGRRCENCFGKALERFYAVQVLSPAQVIPHLESLLDGVPQPEELRGKPRIDKRLRATSPQLPGFRATVADLSETGLGLLVDGTLQRGQRLQLEVDFEDHRIQRMRLVCVVCWCRAEEGGGYRAGLRFEEMPLDQQRELSSVVNKLLTQERGVIHDSSYLRG